MVATSKSASVSTIFEQKIVIKDVSPMEGDAQYTAEVNSNSQMVHYIALITIVLTIHCCTLILVQTDDTFTDIITVCN